MPIRHENRHHYSAAAGWPEIRRQVLAWDRHRCAFCSAPNATAVWRDEATKWWLQRPPGVVQVDHSGHRLVRIVLTVAHLDGSTDHSDPANLRALCQRCHLRHDARQHADSAARTRAARLYDPMQQQIYIAAVTRRTRGVA